MGPRTMKMCIRDSVWGEMDAVTSPTPMAALHSGRLPELDMGQMLLGQHGGSIGEVSIFMLLLGGLYLICLLYTSRCV